MKPMPSKPLMRRNKGFTLVEILVSLVIGLLGIIVMFQVLALWESLKRTTSAGSDAQIAGTVAMFGLGRDLRVAGMGFSRGADGTAVPSLGCAVKAKGPAASFSLIPVQIVNGAGGAPDQIVTLSGNSSLYVSTQKYKSSTASTKVVDGSYGGFKVGDVVVAGGATSAVDCELFEVADVATPGVLGHATALRFNAAPTAITAAAGFLYNLGPLPQRNVWSIAGVNSDKLFRLDSLYTATPVEVAEGIIDLQAQYGIDGFGPTSVATVALQNDGKLEDDDWTTTAPATAAGWSKVIAIRVALLSRSSQFEKTEVTDGGAGTALAPAWTGGAFTMNAVENATGDAANWKRYRYRVYEQVIPLRNVVWGGDFK